jgi:hypothetical protein
MSNRLVKNGVVAVLAALMLGLSLGCESGGRVPPSPEPPPREEPPIVTPPGVPYDPNYDYTYDAATDTSYRQNKDTCEWERYNPNTGEWEPCDPPWWAGQIEPIPIDPTQQQQQEMALGATGTSCGGSMLLSTIDYGIVPDQNGMVSPLVWITTFQGMSNSTLTADDTMDFYMAVNVNWTLATDNDPALLAAIGAENIIWHELPGEPNGAVLHLNDVTVRNLALFIDGTGLAGIDSQTPYGKWKFRYDSQQNLVTVKWKGSLVAEIPLE